jgi:molybdenum cofactor cytidylyltransferase
MLPITVLILAAGASSRMRGKDKLLEPVGGIALLRHMAHTALAAGLPVAVVLPPDRPARDAALDGLNLLRVTVEQASDGMGASLRSGVAAIAPNHAIMVVLADMPDLGPEDLAKMASAFQMAPDIIHRACTANGKPGHPVVFPPWTRDELLQATGDTGARALFMAHPIRLVPLPASRAVTDLDTPEDWAAWHKSQR